MSCRLTRHAAARSRAAEELRLQEEERKRLEEERLRREEAERKRRAAELAQLQAEHEEDASGEGERTERLEAIAKETAEKEEVRGRTAGWGTHAAVWLWTRTAHTHATHRLCPSSPLPTVGQVPRLLPCTGPSQRY